ncbi:DUF6090 family protein [Winogradskyella tangerina]|uniref:DUF6090 family protein n=1 Tax=Winogradskyella tangerina TaxID=2023240 RepID=UPI000DBE30BB|nr:DUF6090 family protein [Winogradskyella tangerina]
MISVLRKVRRKFFSNKWSSYLIYAIGEIALVMIGILLALQVNNWNEERKKNMQLRSILQTVKTDLAADTLRAQPILQFYDSINKYSNKIINKDYDANTIESCMLCRSITTLYQPLVIQDKGYNMLKNFEELDSKKTDTLQSNILQFYKTMTDMIDQSNDFVKSETLKNLEYFKNKTWFVDWMQGRFTDEMKFYFGESVDYRNRVASNFILASQNHAKFIRTHKINADELIRQIDERLSAE